MSNPESKHRQARLIAPATESAGSDGAHAMAGCYLHGLVRPPKKRLAAMAHDFARDRA